MSDPYSPYPPGQTPQGQWPQSSQPPAKSSVPTFAALALVVCIVAFAVLQLVTFGTVSIEDLAANDPEAFAQMEEAGMDADQFRVIMLACGGACSVVVAIVVGVLAWFVAKARLWAMITALVLAALYLLIVGLGLLVALLPNQPGANAATLASNAVMVLVLVATIVLLIMAMRHARSSDDEQRLAMEAVAQQAAWQQYHQQQSSPGQQPPPPPPGQGWGQQ